MAKGAFWGASRPHRPTEIPVNPTKMETSWQVGSRGGCREQEQAASRAQGTRGHGQADGPRGLTKGRKVNCLLPSGKLPGSKWGHWEAHGLIWGVCPSPRKQPAVPSEPAAEYWPCSHLHALPIPPRPAFLMSQPFLSLSCLCQLV